MKRNMFYTCLFLIFFTIFIIPVWSQDNEEKDKENKDKDLGALGSVRTIEMPKDWTIKKEVQTLENSLNNYDPLIQSLEEANQDLKVDLEQYLKDPSNQVLAARITMKMSSYGKKIVWDFDKIIGNQDVLLSVFKELNRKLTKFNGYLDFKAKELDDKVNTYTEEKKVLEKKLTELAIKIKESDDPKVKEDAKKEFNTYFRKYKINSRYEEGFARNKQDYETLSKNLKAMVQIFTVLNEACRELIANLEQEKQYLLDNIRLQADAIQVQKLFHEGISDGQKAIKNITQKLALLYAKVDGFSKVHEKINRDLSRFTESQKVLISLTKEIENTPYRAAPTIEKAIEYFYNNRHKE